MNTIQLPEGKVSVTPQIGNLYVGAGKDKTIVTLPTNAPGADGCGLHIAGDDFGFKDLTLAGGGVFLDKPGGKNNNITFLNVRFKTTQDECIKFTSGLSNSTIKGCSFTGPSFGIYGYNYDGLTIVWNEFIDIAAAMHIDANPTSKDLLVQGNYVERARGMGFEFQGTATNLKFLDNWYCKPNLSSTFSVNNNSFAYSLILDKSANIEIARNVCIAPERPDGKGCRIGFEVGGENSWVHDNYVNGVNQVLACNDGVGACSVKVENNYFADFLEGIGGIRSSAITRVGTNDATTKLAWGGESRGRPLTTGNFAGGASGDTTTNEDEDTVPTLSATATVQPNLGTDGGGIASIAFSNVTGSPTTVKYSGVAAGNKDDSRGIVPEKTVPYASTITVGALPPGYRTRLTFVLLKDGVAVGTCTTDTADAPGSSISKWPKDTTPTTDDSATVTQLKATLAQRDATIATLQAKYDALVKWVNARPAGL